MGFSYSDWSGVFYPEDMKPAEYLGFYARFHDAVELDTTFYATPAKATIERWRDVTPKHFRFCPKVPRLVTHDMPIDKADEPMRDFLQAMRLLGDKLGVVLIQFPPSFHATNVGRLRTFLATLPRDARFAVEFRDRSWFKPATSELLAEFGCAWAAADYVQEPAQVHATTDFLYVRLIGEHERFPQHNREQVDVTERLKWWKAQIESASANARHVHVMFSNDYAGFSIATCNRFREIIGQPVRIPSPADKGQLFG